MGLKSILNEQTPEKPSSRDEDLKLIQGLNEKLRQTEEQIQSLRSQNLTLLSENQELQSKLTTASEQIELLTKRAASVNKTELKNKEMRQSAEEAKSMSDRAVEIAKMEKGRADAAQSRAQRADEAKKEEEKKRREAEHWAQTAKGNERRTKERYTALFYGISIFTVTLAVLTAYSRSSVLRECGRWFADRMGNLISFFLWLGGAYQILAENLSTLFDDSQIAAQGLSIIIFGAVAAGIGIGGVILGHWIVVKARAIREEYEDGTFKGILTASIAISLFYVCLFLYEPIKRVLPLNIFSVWLLLSIIGAAVVNWKEIKGGVERGY